MKKRNLYLTNTPVEEALKKYLAALRERLLPGFEIIPSKDSLDRVTRKAVYARCCSPLFNAAAMDGIAVIAAETRAAREKTPVILKRGKDFKMIDTGDPIHPPYDAVIMAEDLVELDEDAVQILAPAAAWQHIRPIGEDIVAGEMILPGKHTLRPIDIGVLLSGGIGEVEVYKKPRAAIFPTGTEIIESGETPKEGEIFESNSWMFRAMVDKAGGEGVRFKTIPDDYEKIRSAVENAVKEYDMVLVNAGSSAGTEDYTVHVLRELGEVIVHGVAMKPGKPVILAIVKGKPVIGLPGYPVSAYLAFENFALPVLSLLSGRREENAEVVEAVISRRLVSNLKHREYVRVKAGRVDGRLVASPLARGAGAAMSLVQSDGFCIINQNSEGIEAGQSAWIELSRSLNEIDRTAVVTGSHDLILDIIADLMALSPENDQPYFLASTHAGSLGGLMSLERGECHIAPIHLLNEESGEYNISWIKKIFPSREICLIRGVGRVQGIMIANGNPLGITGISSLAEKNVCYINRQRGAGTRLFLDYRLKKEDISQSDITGYDREAATHMAVAAAIQSGSADAGMGISSAARVMGLDFIPLGDEEYDFALPPRFLELPQIKAFIQTLKDNAFHKRLEELGGYTWKDCGTLRRFQGDEWGK
jgi:putative molybdopterin biosynthesis protein